MSGKGDTYRPVDADRYARNYDAIDWGTGRGETEMNHEQESVYAYCCWTQIGNGLFETDCGHRDKTEPNPDWVCCPYCGEVIEDARKDDVAG